MREEGLLDPNKAMVGEWQHILSGIRDCTTTSTWGQFDRVIASEYRDDSEYPIEVSEETLSEEFTKSDGSIDWDSVRDAIAENVFDGTRRKLGRLVAR